MLVFNSPGRLEMCPISLNAQSSPGPQATAKDGLFGGNCMVSVLAHD